MPTMIVGGGEMKLLVKIFHKGCSEPLFEMPILFRFTTRDMRDWANVLEGCAAMIRDDLKVADVGAPRKKKGGRRSVKFRERQAKDDW